MLTWIIAAAAALGVAAFQYQREQRTPNLLGAAVLRFVALTLAFALALDATRARAAARTPVVALDASESWMRGRDSTAWNDALRRARAAARGDTLWIVGDSTRAAGDSVRPGETASRIGGVVDRALAAGRPLLLITDGEIDDPRALDRLLGGSRVDVAAPAQSRDAALLAMDLPRSAVGGDTIEVVVRLVAGAAGAGVGAVTLLLDRMPVIRLPIDTLSANAERDVRARIRIPAEGGAHRIVRAALTSAGDVAPRNDTLAAALDVAAVPSGVFASTAPDQDARFALDVLRGTLSLAVRAFYRVAPGQWRQEPAFTAVTEAAVREALADAPLAIIHGDTALFGQPRAFTTGALALLAPATTAAEDWYAASAPTSPLTGAFTGIPWDSLAPIARGGVPRGEWIGLTVRQPRALRDELAVIAGSEQPRRIVVVAGSGFWRWRFRGGVSADSYVAVWGGLFDWLAAGGDDRRAAVPGAAWIRAGEPVAWRRGARRDSLVVAVLRRIDGDGVDSVMLRFPGDATVAESPALAVGEYEIVVPGGRTRLVVAPSREWLPRRAVVGTGDIGSGSARGFAPRLRTAWWAYVLLLAALCAEWFIRRRAGLR